MAARNMIRIYVPSTLVDTRGIKPVLRLLMDADNELLDAAFFDMDRTLLRLDFIYKPALLAVFPDIADGEALWRLHSDGFKLGTSYREFDRLHGIVRDGRDAWADPDRYLHERQAIIDADGPERRRAADYTGVYAAKAFEVARAAYARDHGVFRRAHIEPTVHMLRLFRRLGAATFCMTANNEQFARMILAMSGLAGDFLDLAGDESMAGGGKEIAIRRLVDRAARRGLRIARDGIMLVGDSLVGDLGVGLKLPRSYRVELGILVVDDMDAYDRECRRVVADPLRRKIVDKLDIGVMILDRLPRTRNGGSTLAGRARRAEYLRRLPESAP